MSDEKLTVADVLAHASETVWLVAEAFGADRNCEGCRKVVRKCDRRDLGYVCMVHRGPPRPVVPPAVRAIGRGR